MISAPFVSRFFVSGLELSLDFPHIVNMEGSLMIKNKMIRDTALLTLMQLSLDSAALLLNVFITRKMGASAIGIFSLMGSFLGFAGILSNGNAFLCTSRLISEEIGRHGSPVKVLFHGIKLCLILSIGASLLTVLSAEQVSLRFFSGAEVSGAVRLMPFALISGAISSCFKGYFNACRRASSAAIGDILEFCVKASVIIVLTLAQTVHNEASVCRIMIISIISGNVTSLLFMIGLFIRHRPEKRGRALIDFRRYVMSAFPIMGGGILTAALSSTNDALIPICLRQFGDTQEQALSLFGIFEAIVIPTLFFPSVVLCSMSGMIVSEAARAQAAGNRERIQSLTSRLLEYTMIFAVFAAAVLLKFGGTIGMLLGGGDLAGKLITTIALVVPFIYMEIVLEALIKGMGLQGFSSLNYLAEYVIRISAVLILVPRIGFAGIAVSYYASNIFGNISRLIKILRYTGVHFAPFRMLISPLVYAVLTCFTAELLCRLFPLSETGVGYMIVMTLIWLAGYGGVFVLLVIFESNKSLKECPVVLNIQRLTQKVM